MDVKSVGGIKSMLFGGEGMFLATLTGPGTVWLQSLPFSRMAGRLIAAAPQSGGKDRGEGSMLGGIGRLLDEIGSASGRERWWRYVLLPVGAGSLKQKNYNKDRTKN